MKSISFDGFSLTRHVHWMLPGRTASVELSPTGWKISPYSTQTHNQMVTVGLTHWDRFAIRTEALTAMSIIIPITPLTCKMSGTNISDPTIPQWLGPVLWNTEPGR